MELCVLIYFNSKKLEHAKPEPQNIEEALNVIEISQFLGARYMDQIRNVIFIIIATVIMAVVTTILAYFFDHLTSNVTRSIARFLLPGNEYTRQL